jgi:hypothetical protein
VLTRTLIATPRVVAKHIWLPSSAGGARSGRAGSTSAGRRGVRQAQARLDRLAAESFDCLPCGLSIRSTRAVVLLARGRAHEVGHAPFWKWVRSLVTAVILLVIAGILIEVGAGDAQHRFGNEHVGADGCDDLLCVDVIRRRPLYLPLEGLRSA